MRKLFHKIFTIRNEGFTLREAKGFTLVELLVVIAIIGILAVGILIALDPVEQTRKAADSNTLRTSTEVREAINRYYVSQSCWPWQTMSSGTCTPISGTCAYSTTYVLGASGCGASITTALVNSGELKSYTGSLISVLVTDGSSSTPWKVIFEPVSKSVATNSVTKYTTTACSTTVVCTAPGSTCKYCIDQ